MTSSTFFLTPWIVANWKLDQDKTKLNSHRISRLDKTEKSWTCSVSKFSVADIDLLWVHFTPQTRTRQDKTVLSCPRLRSENALAYPQCTHSPSLNAVERSATELSRLNRAVRHLGFYRKWISRIPRPSETYSARTSLSNVDTFGQSKAELLMA